jgi:radical SAM superfamily enzyme YgiQ (UPF0313 family)
MSKILFVNPPYYQLVYGNAKQKAGVSAGYVPIGLSSLAAYARLEGHQVAICDLNISEQPDEELREQLTDFQPDVVAVTAVTSTIMAAARVAEASRQTRPEAKIIVGGPHPTAMPRETLEMGCFDALCVGEGEYVLCQWLAAMNAEVAGLWHYENGTAIPPGEANPGIADLDALPFPAYDLLNVPRYNFADVNCRKNPTGLMETSRGCYGNCVYCNKLVHGHKLRFKSAQRVVDEMEYLLDLGFNEIGLMDDCFTADMNRVMEICQEIIKRGLKFPWTPAGGLRVDRVKPEMFKLMKKAGCYRTPFGVETGSARILERIDKRITHEQALEAVRTAKAAGLETFGFFMLGLPGETEEDLKKTIDFAIKLNPHYVKFPFTMPLPGTRLYDELEAAGRIKSHDWEKYVFATPAREIYDHQTLSWDVLEKYEKMAYRKFYLRLSYMFMMFFHTLRDGTFFHHVKALFKTSW